MNSMDGWRMAVRQLVRRRRRNVALGLTIAAGFCGLLLLWGYVYFVEQYLATNTAYIQRMGHMVIVKKGAIDRLYGAPPSLNEQEANSVKSWANSKSWVNRVMFHGRYAAAVAHADRFAPILLTTSSVDDEEWILENAEVQRWNSELFKNPKQWLTSLRKKEFAFSGALADTLRLTPNDREVTLYLRKPGGGPPQLLKNTVTSTFSTGLQTTEATAGLGDVEQVQQFSGASGPSWVSIYLKDRSQLHRFLAELNQMLDERHLDLQAYGYDDERVSPYYFGITQFLGFVCGLFLGLIAVVVVAAFSNGLRLTLQERTLEIGTLRSVGYTPAILRRLFHQEGLLLQLVGLGAGVLLTLLVTFIIDQVLNIRFSPPGISGDAQFKILLNPVTMFELALVFILFGQLALAVLLRPYFRTSIQNLLKDRDGL